MSVLAGVDLGGTKIQVAIVDERPPAVLASTLDDLRAPSAVL